MLSLFTEFTTWIARLPEPAGLLLLGAVLISITSRRLRRVHAPEIQLTPKVVRRRIRSVTGLTAQRGHN